MLNEKEDEHLTCKNREKWKEAERGFLHTHKSLNLMVLKGTQTR